MVVPPGAVLTEWRDGAHDQAGIILRKRFVAQTETGQVPGWEAFQHQPGSGGKLAEDLPAFGLGDIKSHAPFGGVVVPEIETSLWVRLVIQKRPDISGLLAAGRFDLYHVGAQVGHQFAAELGMLARQFQHPDAGQGANRTTSGIIPGLVSGRCRRHLSTS